MPRRAHRRCKEQGPTCLGVTHPGFDICSRCLYDVVRPRLRKQKEAMRAKRAERLSRERLSKENRDLISEVDLKEPQMVHVETDAYIWPDLPRLTVAEAVKDQVLEQRAIELIDKHDSPIDALNEVLINIAALDTPVLLPPGTPLPKHQEEPVEPMPTIEHFDIRKKRNTVTPEKRQEIVDAYKAGEPVDEICRAYDIGIGTLYASLNALNVPRRTKMFQEALVVKASPTVSPIEAPTAPSNGVVSGLTEWVVEFEFRTRGRETVAAASFNDAAQAVINSHRGEQHVEVISVSKAHS